MIGVLPFLDGTPEPGALYDGHIRLELSPNPKLRPFPMLLDTGAAQTVMSPRWASTYAARAGGHVRLDQPGEIVHELSLVNLTEVTDVAITNLTLGEQARATRVFPDGSFDGLVRLQSGENRIRVTTRGDAGGEAVEESD